MSISFVGCASRDRKMILKKNLFNFVLVFACTVDFNLVRICVRNMNVNIHTYINLAMKYVY